MSSHVMMMSLQVISSLVKYDKVISSLMKYFTLLYDIKTIDDRYVINILLDSANVQRIHVSPNAQGANA